MAYNSPFWKALDREAKEGLEDMKALQVKAYEIGNFTGFCFEVMRLISREASVEVVENAMKRVKEKQGNG